MRRVLVIGAGPAGLAAATAARARGASVILLDAADALGGQYWRHLPADRPAADERTLHHGWSRFTALRDGLESDAGCEIITGAQVWAVEAGTDAAPTVHALIGPSDGGRRRGRSFTPDAVVFATGAHDRTLPFPGWDLPGVFTAGAAQAFAKGERVAIGQRVIVAGAGPFLLPVAASLAQTGATVLGVYEASRTAGLLRGWLPRPWQLLASAKKGGELAGYLGSHIRNRIPYRLGRAVIAAHGGERVESVTIARLDADWAPIPGTERRIAADAVCVSHGFTPRLELPIAAGCRVTGDGFIEVDAAQRSSVPGVYAAGEITAIGGADAALAEGGVAGHCAAGGDPSDPELRTTVRARRNAGGFAARIEAAHGIRPGWPAWLGDDTIICRCEEVPYGRLRDIAHDTCSSGLRSLKLSTRAGLGICQGRVCGRTVEQLLGIASGAGESVGSDRRPIAAPVRIGELAGTLSPQEPTEHVQGKDTNV